jgi:hypothetical protein
MQQPCDGNSRYPGQQAQARRSLFNNPHPILHRHRSQSRSC